MPLLVTTTRRAAAPLLVLALGLLAGGHSTAQDKDAPDAKTLAEKLKAGSPALAEVKKLLAADPVGSRVRVEGFKEVNGALEVEGVMLVPGATDEGYKAAEKQARDAVLKAVLAATKSEKVGAFDFEPVRKVRGERLPQLQIQKASNAAGEKAAAADQLKLTGARFNEKGDLVLAGQRGHDPATAKWLADNAAKVLEAGDAKAGEGTKLFEEKATFKVVTDEVVGPGWVVEWPMSPPVIQRAMARSNNPALTRLRVDRAYLVPAPADADETNTSGVTWQYVLSGLVVGVNRPDPKAVEQVCGQVFASSFWDSLKEGDLEKLTGADSRVPEPGAHFQRAIAARPSLDGVRIDERTEFGEDGSLAVVGLDPGLNENQTAELVQTVRGVLTALAAGTDGNPGYRRLAERGITAVKLQPVKVRQLHADLRKWAADNLEDVRLTRLYFDDKSRLTLTCEAPDEAIKAAVEAQLIERAAKVVPAAAKAPDAPPAKEPEKKEPEKTSQASPGRGFTSPVAARLAAQPPKAADPPAVQFGKFPGALTRHLQQVVVDPRNKQWEALLVERGYFDENNQYVVRGVANSEEQKKAFAGYLDSLKKDPEWAPYFAPTPRAEPDLEVIPMTKLVERARRVMPAYLVFDGLRVTEARYVFEKDSRGREGQTLMFDAHAVGRPDLRGAQAKLYELLGEDANYYGRRLPKDRVVIVRVVPGEATPGSAALGEFGVGIGATLLSRGELDKAREWIDAAVLHHPEEASVWFLSAYYNLMKKDAELVRRDLYRVMELEDPLEFDGGLQRKRRYRAAKDIQGEPRDDLEKRWLQFWKEYKDGGARLKFAEPPK